MSTNFFTRKTFRPSMQKAVKQGTISGVVKA